MACASVRVWLLPGGLLLSLSLSQSQAVEHSSSGFSPTNKQTRALAFHFSGRPQGDNFLNSAPREHTRFCYMFFISRCRGESDLGLCMTDSGLAKRMPRREPSQIPIFDDLLAGVFQLLSRNSPQSKNYYLHVKLRIWKKDLKWLYWSFAECIYSILKHICIYSIWQQISLSRKPHLRKFDVYA